MEIWYAGAYAALSEMSSSSPPPPPQLVHSALTFCGPGAGARWQRARRSEQLGCQHRSPDQHRWQAQQGWIPEPHVSQVLRRSPHLETCRQDSIVMFLQELPHMHIWFSAASRLNSEMFLKIQKIMFVFFLSPSNLSEFCPHSHSFHSKMENRLQRRPRSTSMKDRQNSKAQSDRTSSMESECSPDSRLIAQVECYKIWFLFFFFHVF